MQHRNFVWASPRPLDHRYPVFDWSRFNAKDATK
jgi:hypothetical protein